LAEVVHGASKKVWTGHGALLRIQHALTLRLLMTGVREFSSTLEPEELM
jgi:hypothetical protein